MEKISPEELLIKTQEHYWICDKEAVPDFYCIVNQDGKETTFYIKKETSHEDFMKQWTEREFKPFSFDFYSDWDSFIFWQPMNWRDFCWCYLNTEIGSTKWLEFSIALLGFHFNFNWFRKYKEDDDNS